MRKRIPERGQIILLTLGSLVARDTILALRATAYDALASKQRKNEDKECF
ncbi:hypothetical protein J6T66_04890 [bacterium]|nr:hypothetical protein [bacterium]